MKKRDKVDNKQIWITKKGFRNEFGMTQKVCHPLIEAKRSGGGGEIRTHGRVAPTTIFKTVAFNRSATPPSLEVRKQQTTNSKKIRGIL